MAEFKGTKEEKAKHYAENWEEITGLDWEDSIPVKISELDYLAGYNQALEDFKAPEMLEMLKYFTAFPDEDFEEDMDKHISFPMTVDARKIKEAKQLIKEATEL